MNITLIELHNFAMKHKDTTFNMQSCENCLACQLVKEKDDIYSVYYSWDSETACDDIGVVVANDKRYRLPQRFDTYCTNQCKSRLGTMMKTGEEIAHDMEQWPEYQMELLNNRLDYENHLIEQETLK